MLSLLTDLLNSRLQEGKFLMDKRPIGIFDSGLGGLSAVKAVLKYMPNENIVYFGDTQRSNLMAQEVSRQ